MTVHITGKDIKNIRESIKLDQSIMAEFFGISENLLSKIENEEEGITTGILKKLESLVGVPIDLWENPLKPNQSPIPSFCGLNNLSAKDLEALSAVNRIALNLEYMANIAENI